MLKIENIVFSYGEKPVFIDTSFIVGEKQKVGLIGNNGSGKTTLFRLITKDEEPKEGNISIIGKVSFVPQEIKSDHYFKDALSIEEYLNITTDNWGTIQTYFSYLGLTKIDINSCPKNLSGGQKTKLAIIKALLTQPDILLLDEPTNFLDDLGKKFILREIANYPKTIIVVSHDIALLDKVIDKVLFINPHTKTIDEYRGNYTKFQKLKKEKEETLKRHVVVEAKHIKTMEESLKKLYKFTSKKGVRQRVMLERRIEKLKENLPELPKEILKIKVQLPEPLPVGELVIKVQDITKSFGSKCLFSNLSFSLLRKEKLVIIGPNGTGKSTLIKLITGEVIPDSGNIILAHNLEWGYFSQEFESFDQSKTLMETFTDKVCSTESFTRAFLGRFNFLGSKVFQKIETLSGGEKTRFSIAILTALKTNLLILDEPTTYLDPMSQRIILEALKDYKGTMLLVSHTPQFVQEINPTKAILLPEQRVTLWDEALLERIGEL